MFVNREYELDFLNEKWKRHWAELIIIYGKRRVGKPLSKPESVRGKTIQARPAGRIKESS